MNGYELIKQERQRQKAVEGWTPEHDMHHVNSELKTAALCYWGYGTLFNDEDIAYMWPWERIWWKPNSNTTKNLIKAGALYMAENDRTGTRVCDVEITMIAKRIDERLQYLSNQLKSK